MVRARYFDGRTSRAHEVSLRPQAGELAIEGEGVALRVPVAGLEVGEPLEGAPRILSLAGGARLEAEPGPALDLLLEVLGHREGRVSRWQRRWSLALASAVGALVLLGGGYRYGLPFAADEIARRIPEEWGQLLGAHALEALDRTVFEETQLPRERRDSLAARLAALRPPEGEAPPHELHFRASPRVGANAFALPSGELVVTDALVELAESDEELLGVLAHELGHLHGRHSLRGLIQSSIVGILVGLWLGDVSSLATGLPAFLLDAKYSRDFEREADAYAAALLRANGLGTRPLAHLLARLGEQGGEGKADASLAGYLSSHPATEERIRALARPDPG